ncbi:hypothetical protein ABZ780_29105 [Micromonospora sp. NPDC047467]|uniref:hypothetical protein n=1 Tax=Micromonospora sp. NPDC047467 TaxID=3154814 RepID=UPI0033FD2082
MIHRERRGTDCSGRQARIDAVIQGHDSTAWKDDDVTFGLEFKLPGRDSGIKGYTKWIAQAADYTHVDWDGFGRLPILTCPGPAAWLDRLQQHPSEDPLAGLARRLTGQLGLGEVQLRWHHGLTIIMNGEQFWSERYGVRRGRIWSTKLKVGSR